MDHSMLPEPLNTELANLMDELQRPPSGDELAGGRQPALKTRWADWFVVLRNNLEAGEETPPGWGILRVLSG